MSYRTGKNYIRNILVQIALKESNFISQMFVKLNKTILFKDFFTNHL